MRSSTVACIHDPDMGADDAVLVELLELNAAVGQVESLRQVDDIVVSLRQSAKGAEEHVSGKSGKRFDVQSVGHG